MEFHYLNETSCASQSVGPVNQLFSVLVQTLLAFQCSVSPDEMWPTNYGPTTIRDGLDEYDFIIVGGGTAGCVLANRLTEISEWKVLLLEAGGNPPSESEIPSLSSKLKQTKFDWAYRGRSQNACLANVNGSCNFPAGKILGGSHATNAMIYLRGNDRDYNKWEELGNPTWDWESVLPYFKKSEGNQNTRFVAFENGKYHSSQGELIVDAYGSIHPLSQNILAGAREAGFENVMDLNAGKWVGYSQVQGTIHKWRRQSTAKNFLIPAAERPNLHVITDALVSKIEIENDKAVGVRFTYDDREFIARNRKEIVLSAGALESPHLLMLSGIGPRNHLEQLGIPVKKDLAVGENLHDHAAVHLFIALNSDESEKNDYFDSLDDLYELTIHNRGPLTGRGVNSFCALLSTHNDTKYPDYQLQFTLHRRGTNDVDGSANNKIDPVRDALLQQSRKTDILEVHVLLLKPKSRGRIKLKSQSISDQMDIDLNFLAHEDDIETLVRAVKQQIALTNTQSYRALGAEWLRLPLAECDHLEFKSDEYYRCYVRHLCTTNFHIVGTSKMSDTHPDAVVDHRLRIKGVKNLRQADNGIVPVIPSGNTLAVAIMIAEKAADFIKADWPC